MSEVCGPVGGFGGGVCGGGFTNTGVVLVLFILLVIISCACSGGFGY